MVMVMIVVMSRRRWTGVESLRAAAGERIECGVLVVHENRAAVSSREIRLPVRIFRSRSATPAKDPLLFVPGGPGGCADRLVRPGCGAAPTMAVPACPTANRGDRVTAPGPARA